MKPYYVNHGGIFEIIIQTRAMVGLKLFQSRELRPGLHCQMSTNQLCVLVVVILLVFDVTISQPLDKDITVRSLAIQKRSDKPVKNDKDDKKQKPITLLLKLKRPEDVEHEEEHYDHDEDKERNEDGLGATYVGRHRAPDDVEDDHDDNLGATYADHKKPEDDNVSANFEDIIDESDDDHTIGVMYPRGAKPDDDSKEGSEKYVNNEDSKKDTNDGLGATYVNDDGSVNLKNIDGTTYVTGKDYDRFKVSTDDMVDAYFKKKTYRPEDFDVRVVGGRQTDGRFVFDRNQLKNLNKIFERVTSGRQRRSRLYYNADDEDDDAEYGYGDEGGEDEEEEEEEEEEDEEEGYAEHRRRREIRDAVEMVDAMDDDNRR